MGTGQRVLRRTLVSGDTPLEIALERLALRHMQAWGITRDAAEHRIATSDRLNAALVQSSARFADWQLVV
jgi:hypothetical protein